MKVAIISPSAPSTFSEERKSQYLKGLENMKAHGMEYVIMPHAANALSYVSDTAANRLADFMEAYRDESVDLVMTANGGWNAGDILADIDWEVVKRNPKTLVGFSDITALLNAAYAHTGRVQIQGPMVTWGFQENDPLTIDCFMKAVNDKRYELPLEKFGKFLRGTTLEGIGVGGNLVSLESLLGTPHVPDWEGKVLFWEETEEKLPALLRALAHFKNVGALEKLAGMIIGRLDQIDGKFAGKEHEPLAAVFDYLEPYSFPIMKTELFGHEIDQYLPLPVGGKITADSQSITFGF
ncbi:LD-carboxypeptidase [Candidatus Uhrbacteria bacterium]|nr:LD-carboxypeptidase [Candidatus Uhrbacteria bacterium]